MCRHSPRNPPSVRHGQIPTNTPNMAGGGGCVQRGVYLNVLQEARHCHRARFRLHNHARVDRIVGAAIQRWSHHSQIHESGTTHHTTSEWLSSTRTDLHRRAVPTHQPAEGGGWVAHRTASVLASPSWTKRYSAPFITISSEDTVTLHRPAHARGQVHTSDRPCLTTHPPFLLSLSLARVVSLSRSGCDGRRRHSVGGVPAAATQEHAQQHAAQRLMNDD